MQAVKPGYFATVGDLVREGWCRDKRCVAPPYTYGIVLETQNRSLEAYTPEQCAEKPVRLVYILTTAGEKIRRYAVHVEVMSESR